MFLPGVFHTQIITPAGDIGYSLTLVVMAYIFQWISYEC